MGEQSKVYALRKTNYYHGKSVSIEPFYAKTEKEGMDYFDEDHYRLNHSENFCDYCRTGWVRKYGTMIKNVDHDGAYVEYEVLELKEL